MITADDLAKINVHRLIFHDVPRNIKGGAQLPTLADNETDLDTRRAGMLKDRLIRVLGASSAYPVQFLNETGSPVPDAVRQLTALGANAGLFVQSSRKIATHLFELQNGPISAGLLCVVDVTAGTKRGIAIMKLEREEGAKLEMLKANGKIKFSMSVLDDLVLTEGTRLFKSALFVREDDGSFACVACDVQNGATSSADVALFWLKFLGCSFTKNPRVSTQQWFDTTTRFVNEQVADPIAKNRIYEHLVSELNSNKIAVAPKKFAEEYVVKELRQPYLKFLGENGIPLQQFRKDVSDIESKLRRRAFHTDRGITVSAPADAEDLVEIGKTNILVNDKLKKIR